MLVLRRKAGEAIVLNGVITIHVLAVEGERVKLGISAPPEVVIVRSELLEGQGPSAGPSAPQGYGPPVQRPFRESSGNHSANPEQGTGPRRDFSNPGPPPRFGPRGEPHSAEEEPAPARPDPLRLG